VWGLWGLPVVVLALLLGMWAFFRIRRQPEKLRGRRLTVASMVLCLLAGPVWYGTMAAAFSLLIR
jgi:hypothetical protein